MHTYVYEYKREALRTLPPTLRSHIVRNQHCMKADDLVVRTNKRIGGKFERKAACIVRANPSRMFIILNQDNSYDDIVDLVEFGETLPVVEVDYEH